MTNLPEVKDDEDSTEITEHDESTEIDEQSTNTNNLPIVSYLQNKSKIDILVDFFSVLVIIAILLATIVYVADIRVLESEPTDQFLVITPMDDVDVGQSVVYFDGNRTLKIGQVSAIDESTNTVTINDSVGGEVETSKNTIRGEIVWSFARPDYLKGLGEIFNDPV